MKHFYEQPWYFAHIPKSGGTTFIAFFDRLFPAAQIFPHQLLWDVGKISKASSQKYQFFRGHFNAFGEQLAYRETNNLTILRNPIDMAYSSYKHTLRDKNTKLHEKVAGEKWSFEDFINSSDSKNLISNRMTKFLQLGAGVPIDDCDFDLTPSTFGRFKRQKKIKQGRPEGEKKFQLAMAYLKRCFWVGVLEDLPKSMDVLCSSISVPPVSDIPVLNRSQQLEKMSVTTKERLTELNVFDFKLLEWAQNKLAEDHVALCGESTENNFQLIDKNYRKKHGAVFKKQPQSSIVMTMGHAMIGDQWYQREHTPTSDGFFRWSGPGRHAFLDFWLDRKDYALEMIISNHCLTGWDELTIDANQNKITYTVNKIGNAWKIGAKINKAYIEKDGFLRLSLIVEKTKKHNDVFDSNDNRLIGVALNQVVIK